MSPRLGAPGGVAPSPSIQRIRGVLGVPAVIAGTLFGLASGCRVESPESAPLDATEPAGFTILGRFDDPRGITYRVETQHGSTPVGVDLGAAVARAIEAWNASGLVSFRAAPAGSEAADVVFSFQEGVHGGCAPFGFEGLAHAGPVGPGSFVHFNAGADWSQPARIARSAAHELGHVLGLGHSSDKTALLYGAQGHGALQPAPDDLAALRSLYGDGEDTRRNPGDVDVLGHSGARLLSLVGVAPAASTDLAVLDTDGDGDEELLVWRNDERGQGALMVFHFSDGPQLARTVGPFYGVVVAGMPHVAGKTTAGERVLCSVLPGGKWLARTFDDAGIPHTRPWGPFRLGGLCDEDGDGHFDDWDPAHTFDRGSSWSADLDGNGIVERIVRR